MNVEGSSSRSGEVGEFDFAAYIAGYHGFAKAVKCRFIAEKSPKLAVVAFHTLIQEIQTGFNVHFYKSAVAALVPELGLDYQADAQWLTNADKKAAAIYEKHDQQLTAAKTNLNKLAVRAAQFALGDYYVQRGEFNSAVKCYMRCRDDCKDPPSSFALYMRIVRAHLLAGQFVQAANYASRAERAAEALPPSEVRASYLAGVAGLAALVSRAYRNAARDLCNVRLPPSQDDAPASVPVSADKKAAANDDDDDDDVDDKKPQKAAAKESAKVPAALSDAPGDGAVADTVTRGVFMPEVMTGSDVALYATLSALAALDRGEVKRRVLDNEAFSAVLSTMPEARLLLEDFVASRYASLFERLGKLRPRMQLDSVLAPLAAELEVTIRQKALKQYFGPYSSVDLTRMAAAFACDVEQLEDELAQLIADDHIQARIDSHNKRLFARQSDERADTFAAVINAGEAYVRNMQALLLKLNLGKLELSVRVAPRALPMERGERGDRELPHKMRDKRRK